jgi:hypothetical protein
MSDPYYDQLVSSGKLRAAEIYLATLAKSGMSVATLVALDSAPDQKIIKIHCSKVSCRESILMPRSSAHRWFCDTHQVSGPVAVANTEMAPRELRREKTQVRWKGRVYTAHYIGSDGVAFKLKNGNTVNLEPSRVEWV